MIEHESLPLSDNQRSKEVELLERSYADSDMYLEGAPIADTPDVLNEHRETDVVPKKVDDLHVALTGLRRFNPALRHRVRVYNKTIDRLQE